MIEDAKIRDNLYKKILSTKNSVALCIRFYEESKEPGIHSLNGRNIKLSQKSNEN